MLSGEAANDEISNFEDTDSAKSGVIRNICEVRARMRNDCRTVIEETTNIFGRKIAAMSAEDIMTEEKERLLARARRNLRTGVIPDVREAYEEALRHRAEKAETESLQYEEYGKYVAGNIVRRWEKKGVDQALENLRIAHARNFINPEMKKKVLEETAFVIGKHILKLIRSGGASAAIEGMLKFAQSFKVSRGDLQDAGMTAEDEKVLLLALEPYLARMLDTNPRIYDAVGTFFSKNGFKKVAEMKESPLIRNVVRQKIIEAAQMGMSYLSELVEVFEELGLIEGGEVKKWPEVVKALGARLGETAKKAPAAYVQMRDYYAETGIISKEEADNLPQVKEGINMFLTSLTEIHPEFGMIYAAGLNNDGVKVALDEHLAVEWRRYASRFGTGSEDLEESMVFNRLLRRKMEELALNANHELDEDRQHELRVFNGVRHMYGIELSRFLIKYPYFREMFPGFRQGEFIGDGD